MATNMTSEKGKAGHLAWRKSSICGSSDDCAEVACIDGTIAVRDSKSPGMVLRISPSDWKNFLKAIKSGSVDSI